MALTTGLVYWGDFTGDNVNDRHSSGNDLTENGGSITYGAGTPGRAVTVPAGSSNFLSVADASAADFEIGTGSMTYCFRFKSNTYPVAFNSIYTKGGSGGTDAGMTITHKNNGEFLVRIADGTNFVQNTHNDTLSLGTEGFFFVIVDRSSNNEIITGLDDGATESTDLSSISTSTDIQSDDDVKFCAGFQNNGDMTFSFIGVWNRALSLSEVAHVRNGTEGMTYESELQRDGWDPTSNCARWKITAKAAEIGGTGTQTAHDLVIDSDSLPDTLKDSDSTYHITSGNVRASLDSAGAKQIPLHVIEASPNATPASADYEIRVLPEDHFGGDNTLDGTNGTDIYLWCGFSGATVSPASGLYGSQSVYEDNIPLALTGQDSTDATRNGNDGTDSLMQTNVTTAPYGVEARDFDSGVTSRIVIGHDPSLSADTDVTTEHWFYCTSDTGTFQGLMSKRRNTIANYTQAINVGGDVSAKFTVNNTFYGLDVSWNTYFALNTWYHIIAEWETSGFDTICRIFQDGTQIGTATVTNQNLVTNSEDITIGAIQTSGAAWSFPFDGHQKGHIIRKALWSDDQKTTRYNNQSSTSDFWDTTAAVEEPGGDDHTLATNDLSVSTALDTTTITQNHVLSPVDSSVSATLDTTTITQGLTVSPNDLSVSTTLDTTTITQAHVLSPVDLSVSSTLDATTVTEENDDHTLAPNDLSVSISLDTTTITQSGVLAPNDLSVVSTLDATVLTQNHVLGPLDLSITTTLDTTLVILPSDVSTASTSLGATHTGSVSLGTF